MSPGVPPGPSGDAGPHAFVADLDAPALDEGDRHHLANVLRLRPGQPVTLSDGAGRWRAARFGPELRVEGDIQVVPAPQPPITVAFALMKGDRPAFVTQKLTELGVDRIVPFRARRSVVRWDEPRAGRQVERLRRVAREAAMQSRRCHLPEVCALEAFEATVGRTGAVLADRMGGSPSLERTVVLVGPEGGWAPEEQAAAPALVGLGPHVLRAETAAVAAAAVFVALRARLVTECG